MGVLLWGLGACTIQSVKCHCQITMVSGPNGYRCGCQWVGCYGAGGLHNQLFGVPLHNGNGQCAPMAIIWCPSGVLLWGFGGCAIQLLDGHGKVAMVNLACWVKVRVPLGVLL